MKKMATTNTPNNNPFKNFAQGAFMVEHFDFSTKKEQIGQEFNDGIILSN